MANRFLETNYYKSPFVRKLPGPLKALYSFIICDCTPSGIWSLDLEAAAIYTGFTVSVEDFADKFVSAGKAIDIGGDKFFFPDFIEHQYPSGLISGNNAHKNVILDLKKLGFLNDDLTLKKRKELTGAPLPLSSPPMGDTGNGYGKGNGQDQGYGKGHPFGKSENLFSGKERLVPRMNEIWITTFSAYSAEQDYDFPALKKIADFIFKQAGIDQGFGNADHETTCLNTFQLIADQVNREPFWVNKPLQSISKNIQEFYNKIKNPQENAGTKSTTSPTNFKTLGQDKFANRLEDKLKQR